MSLSDIQIVLVRTREPQNLGAAARAMKNAGLAHLTLVTPLTTDLVTARRVGVHAGELLAAPRVTGSIAEAVEDARWVVGTTSRAIPGQRRLTPRQVAEEALRRGGRVALVFGDEVSGLTNDDLLACHDVSCIPASSEQPSYNLAQSVVIYAYELLVASGATPAPVAEERATERELQQLERALRELLTNSGFADPDRPRHGVRELAQTLRRSGLSLSEAKLWLAALRRAAAEVEKDELG